MALVTLSVKDKLYAFAEQSAFATAVDDDGTTGSPATTFTEVDCEPFNIDMDVKIRNQIGSHATRSMTFNDMQTDEKGSIPKFSVTADAKFDDIDLFASAYFQEVTEGAGPGVFSKTFTLPSTQPDFTVDAGFFYTWVEYHPTASTSWKVHDSICEGFMISSSPGERVQVQTDWQANKAGSTVSNVLPAATSRPALEYHYYEEVDRFTVAIAGGGTNVCIGVGDIEFAFKQELIPVGHDGAGNYQTFAIGARTGTFKCTINKDATANLLIAAWKNDDYITWNWSFGNASPGTVDGDLDLACTGKIDKVEIDTNNVLGAVVTGQILAPDSSTSAATLIVANGVDRTW